DGKTYQIDGEDRYWKGLKNDVTKESLLADYVYYLYHTDQTTITTEVGEVAMDNKIGNRVSVSRKATKAYNSFLSKLHGGVRSGASGWTAEGNPFWVVQNRLGNNYGIDYYGMTGAKGEVSLIQFLHDNQEVYPLLDLNIQRFGSEFKNEFGI